MNPVRLGVGVGGWVGVCRLCLAESVWPWTVQSQHRAVGSSIAYALACCKRVLLGGAGDVFFLRTASAPLSYTVCFNLNPNRLNHPTIKHPQGCLPDKLFAAFKPIPREDEDEAAGEGGDGGAAAAYEDPFEPSELPGAAGASQEQDAEGVEADGGADEGGQQQQQHMVE